LNVNNEKFILQEGGLQLIMIAMRRFPRNLQLQETVCSVLADFSRKGSQMEFMLNGDVVGPLLYAIRTFPDRPTISRAVVSTLKNLANYSDKFKQEIVESGALSLIL